MRGPLIFLAAAIVACCGITAVNAQTVTQTSVLREAATKQAALEIKNQEKLAKLALQHGWPMTIQGRKGRFAVLTGVDPAGLPLYVATDNNTRSAATIGTTQLWPGGSLGLNLSGASNAVKGKLGIWDGGKILNNHIEFGTRITQKDNATTVSDHATHVAGTLIAAGNYSPAKGMAFGEQELIAYEFTNHLSEMLLEAPNLLLSNHSYGSISGWSFNQSDNRWEFWGESGANEDYKFGYYSAEAQVWDSIAYNAPYYLIVKSVGNARSENGPDVGSTYWRFNASGTMANAGNRPIGISNNDGYDIIPTYGTAKNILTVGAVEPIESGYTRKEDVVLGNFSSWGPTDDGRIKPDLVANGINVVSTSSASTNAYENQSGTSMSSPAVAGSLLLLQEYYNQLHPGNFMRSATLKGLAIHTASEAGPADGPDYQHGWGLLNMPKAAEVIAANNSFHRIEEAVLNNGATYTLNVVASGKGQLMATICWTDPKGEVITSNRLDNDALKLINDLDLRIKKGATTYLPWILNPASPAAAATKADNFRDNVERVELADVIPGEAYTIEVTHKGTLQRGSQAFSLIVSGVGGVAYCNSGATSTAGARIDSVSFGPLAKNNAAGCTNYTNYATSTANIETNSVVPYFVKLSSCDASNAGKIVKAFIDFNNDGDFNDAGELVATSAVINGNGNFTGNANIPAGLKTGYYTTLRIIVQETTDPNTVLPCGSYLRGETQDFRVQFVAPSKDIGLSSILAPEPETCAGANQYVSVKIKNFGSIAQSAIPLTLTVTGPSGQVLNLNSSYPGTIAAYSEAVYTFQTGFTSAPGATYTITAATNAAGDQQTTNNQLSTVVTMAGTGPTAAGQAQLCGANQALLKVTAPETGMLYSWYDGASANTPVATGSTASTSVIPAGNTYYLSRNESVLNLGPTTKSALGVGGYNVYVGNFVEFSNSVPLLIESARLYIGNPGRIRITVADISNFDPETGSYNYLPLASTTFTVYATDPTPIGGAQNDDPADQGAVFLINLPVIQTGSHALIMECLDGATIFRNNGVPANSYPFSIPGVMSITGNSAKTTANPNNDKNFYYFFYNMKLGLAGCAGPRTAITATAAPAPVITENNNVLTSTAASAYQWYRNGSIIGTATGQTYTITSGGTYKVRTTDAFGCQQFSNEIVSTVTATVDLDGSDISLKALPNPSNGIFNLQFEMKKKADLSISIINVTGQEIFRKNYPGFIGKFAEQINAGKFAADAYMLKIQHGDKIYLRKLIFIKN